MNDDLTGLSPPFIPGRKNDLFPRAAVETVRFWSESTVGRGSRVVRLPAGRLHCQPPAKEMGRDIDEQTENTKKFQFKGFNRYQTTPIVLF